LHIQCLRCIHTPFVLNPPTSVSSRYRVFSPSIRASPNPFPLRPRCWCGAGPRPPNHPPFPPPGGPLRPRSPPRCTARRLISVQCRSGSLLKSRFSSQNAVGHLPQRSQFYFHEFSIFPFVFSSCQNSGPFIFLFIFHLFWKSDVFPSRVPAACASKGSRTTTKTVRMGGHSDIPTAPTTASAPAFSSYFEAVCRIIAFGIELLFAYVAMYTDLIFYIVFLLCVDVFFTTPR